MLNNLNGCQLGQIPGPRQNAFNGFGGDGLIHASEMLDGCVRHPVIRMIYHFQYKFTQL